MKAILELLGKKRFWLPAIGSALVAFVTVILNQLGLPEDLVLKVAGFVAGLFGAGVLNNAAADFGKESKK